MHGRSRSGEGRARSGRTRARRGRAAGARWGRAGVRPGARRPLRRRRDRARADRRRSRRGRDWRHRLALPLRRAGVGGRVLARPALACLRAGARGRLRARERRLRAGRRGTADRAGSREHAGAPGRGDGRRSRSRHRSRHDHRPPRLRRPRRRAGRDRRCAAVVKNVPLSPEIHGSEAFQQLRRAWPEIVFHDAISNAYWGRLYDERPEFQFALVDDDGRVLAEGNSIPVSGLPPGWRDAFPNGFGEGDPDRLCALAILIDPDRQGEGLSRLMLEHMRGLAAARGWDLFAPVRPNLKHRYPLTPIERYIEWRRDDGLLFDPWLRAHERAGAEVLGPAPDSLISEGTVAELEEWCGLQFPESGSYVVEGALVPVEIDRESDRGSYREPNVWMRHPA